MQVYNYDANTKEFLSQSQAQKSPLEEGVYLIPANATEIKPNQKEGYVCVFDEKEQKWKHVKDLRGIKLYHKNTKEMIVCSELGFDDSEYTNLEPSEFSIWSDDSWREDENAKARALKLEQIKELKLEIEANKEAQDNASYSGNTEILAELQSEYLELYTELINLKKEIDDE